MVETTMLVTGLPSLYPGAGTRTARLRGVGYSHSMVAGGFEEMS